MRTKVKGRRDEAVKERSAKPVGLRGQFLYRVPFPFFSRIHSRAPEAEIHNNALFPYMTGLDRRDLLEH
jgi:hypothetical protein